MKRTRSSEAILTKMKRKRSSEASLSMETKPESEYDVFLSFRGSDTRLNFTDYLYRSLVRVGIRVFLDSEELEDGEKISEVLKAVNESRICIPIFSQNFASSSWCLREVTRMVECTSESDRKKEIIPIFYDVRADDVKLKTDLYTKAILKHKEKVGSDELERWKSALVEIGGRIGRELMGKRQGEEIDSIVEQVSRKLNTRHMSVTEHFVEDSVQVEAIMKLLDIGSDSVLFVGIHGMAGIGKTTLATVLYNKLSTHFEGCVFLEDVRVHWQPPGGPLDLQKKLLSHFVNFRDTDQIKNVDDGIKMIKRVFNNKKILIVLDDLDEKRQLERLAGKYDWFCSGSRIIFTTRDKSILRAQLGLSSKEVLNQPNRILAYEVHPMKLDIALHLFCKHAFRSDSVVEEYDALSREIVLTVGMLPLAVVVIGSHLFDMGNDLWHSNKKEVWDETLEKLKEGPFDDVRDTLLISYERLKPKEKEVFLDIACFFTNEDITYPVIMWKDCSYHPHTAITVLDHKSLIKIRDDKFWMHDQVRDFGRGIVFQEYPHKIRRVWIREKVLELLQREERNEAVEAVSLMSSGHNFTREELACLPKLRFLRVKASEISGNFKDLLRELRWLSWQTLQTTFHANNFHFSNLVILNLSDSNIEDDWGGWNQMKMDRLKVLDLTGCILLKKTPDFSNFMSLEKLILARCVMLTTIDRSIGKLKLLKTLNIKGCGLLRELPKEVGALQYLTEVIMPQTFQPFNLPETFGNLVSLSSLILDKLLGISQLPSSIGGLVKVTYLSLRWCVGIKKLPYSLGKMEMLGELDLSMSGIVELPDSIEYLKKLKVIRVSYTMIRKFPHTIGRVEMLEELHAKKCWNLTDENLEEIGKLSHLKILDLSYTHVSRFPAVLYSLSRLKTLELGSSDLQGLELPSSLTRLHMQARQFPSILDLSSLVNLDYLELSILTVSREEPDPSWTNNSLVKQLIHQLPSGLSTLKCRGIWLLPPLSNLRKLTVLCVIEYPVPYFSISQELIHLTELTLSKCKYVEIICVSCLKNLQHLVLNRLDRLIEIQGLSELESLLYFRISDCYNIERLPNLSKLDKLWHIELEACPKIRAIEGIEGLESLVLYGCTVAERLVDVSRSTWLSHKLPKCQVFLSFSGLDTPYSIVDVLHENLVRNRILVFRDDDALSSGDGIGEVHPQALKDSRVYIPFLSKSYASCWWCLRELAHMVKCTSKSYESKIILPILYDVEVEDVKLESTLYRNALDNHRRKFGNEVEKWEMALRKVAEGRVFNMNNNSQGEQIELIVEEVSRKLLIRTEHLVEDTATMESIMELLDVRSGGVRFVGIHGMGGVGKTILAKVMFNKLFSQFERFSFLEEVRVSSRYHGGLLELQKNLLSDLSGHGIANKIKDVHGGIEMIKEALSNKKVLIVLDDLDKKEQLENLAGKSNWFCSGSRIIITTRDESVLMAQVDVFSKEVLNQPEGILRYEVHGMRFDLALRLFCKYAFRSDSAPEEYGVLSTEIIRTVGMLPLAIEVIGSYLFALGNDLEHLDKRKVWDNALKKSKEGPFQDVQDSLMISYLTLEDREIFCDIAWLFINTDKTYSLIMWEDCGYFPSTAMRVLSQRSFIKIKKDNSFWMHDQVQDLGRYIVLHKYPCKFCRVWIHEDSLKLLEGEERNEDVVALSLTFDGCSRSVECIDILGNFKNLRLELRWFSWESMQKEFYAESFHFPNLVVLDLSRSNIEDDWGGWRQMQMTNKLKILDLTDCTKLTRTPDFSNFTSLEMLVLARCSNLITIHPSISKLQLLEILNVKGCGYLQELPEEVSSLLSLQHIVMPKNFQPLKLPERFGNLKSLLSLRLSLHPKMCRLPDSIGGAMNLICLTLRGCVGIKELPSSIGELKMLVELDVSNSGIVELPDLIGNLKKLRELRLSRTKIKEFPHTIGGLEMLEVLDAHKSWDLTDKNLEEIGKLFHLKTLILAFTSVSRLPPEISRLHLQKLEVGSIDLQQVPSLPSSLKFLAVQAMDFSVVPHPSSITDLEQLELYRFSNLRRRHPSTRRDYDSKLKAALMREQPCYQLPSHLSDLKLKSISPLPQFSNLLNLRVLYVIECPISRLPVTPGLTNLRKLYIERCECLEEIPGLSLLRSLESLELKGLNRLVEIQGLSELENLQYLLLSSCDLIGQLPNLSKLGKLQHLELEACPNLRPIEGIEGLESWMFGSRDRAILGRLLNICRSTWLFHTLPITDVFLSFKGLDIHHSIVSYLHSRMRWMQMCVYSDNDDLRSNEETGEKILQALANSNIYVPIFSRNYASSHWCLHILAHMVKCKSESKEKRRILPIFYDVEIDDVKLKTDLYKSDLDKHQANFNHDEVKSWKEALIKVAALRGFVLKTKSYEEVLQSVTEEVYKARTSSDVDS